MIHFDNGRDSFRSSEPEHRHFRSSRNRISVERPNLEGMPRQRQAANLRCATIQYMKEDSLSLLHPHRLAVSQHAPVDREIPVAHFIAVRHAFREGCFHRRFARFFEFFHLRNRRQKILRHVAALAEGRLEFFLVLKEFEPSFSQGGDMAQDFLAPIAKVKELEKAGESSMKASLAKGMPHGYEVGYRYFTINGRMLGHGETVRVKEGERVLFHVLNGSATEIRSLALPGHSFKVVALDGNPVPTAAEVPVLWLGTAERISAIVEMNHPGSWIMGDLADDDRGHGMGIVIEYAGYRGKPVWTPPKPFHWNYTRFAKAGASAFTPDETFDMTFAKENAAEEGFNQWTINGARYPMAQGIVPASFHLKLGKRYRLRMHNASDDIHPIHLHRHSFELTKLAGVPTAGVMKDVVMVGGYQEVEVDFLADNPGLTLFHCHQQLHMDFGFMTLFDYG